MHPEWHIHINLQIQILSSQSKLKQANQGQKCSTRRQCCALAPPPRLAYFVPTPLCVLPAPAIQCWDIITMLTIRLSPYCRCMYTSCAAPVHVFTMHPAINPHTTAGAPAQLKRRCDIPCCCIFVQAVATPMLLQPFMVAAVGSYNLPVATAVSSPL